MDVGEPKWVIPSMLSRRLPHRSEQKLHAGDSNLESRLHRPFQRTSGTREFSQRCAERLRAVLRPHSQEVAMESRAKLLGHSIHQMLIVFPLGLLATAVIFDIIYLFTGRPSWTDASYHMIPAGIIGGLIAAVFGLLDWLKIPPGTRAWRIGAWHGAGNVLVVLLFAVSWWMRRAAPSTPSGRALVFSFLGILLALVTGWLGGELIDRLGVGVDTGAHLDAPSSLSGRSAHETDRQVGKADAQRRA
jgi:uncharacterized membrane protein